MTKKKNKVPRFIRISHSKAFSNDKKIQKLLKKIEVIDEIDYRGRKYPIARLKEVEINEYDKLTAISAIRAEETLINIFKKLDNKEKKIIDARYDISLKYFDDALNCNTAKARMVLFTIACEILYETIARIVTKSIKSTTNLHRKFRRSHAIKLRFGFDELKPFGVCLFGVKIKIKDADYDIGDLPASEKDFFKALQNTEKYDEGFFSDWIFKHGRYIISKKFDKYLNKKHNLELFASYIHLKAIFIQLRKGNNEFYYGGLKEDKFIGILCLFSEIKISDKKSISLKDFYQHEKKNQNK